MELKKEYYNSKDIMEILGCCRTTAYQIIDKMNDKLKAQNENILIFKNKVPIWYWDICTKPMKEVKKCEN